jgi:hypothetical protein
LPGIKKGVKEGIGRKRQKVNNVLFYIVRTKSGDRRNTKDHWVRPLEKSRVGVKGRHHQRICCSKVFLRSYGCQPNWHWIDNLICGYRITETSALILTCMHSRKSDLHFRLRMSDLLSSSRSGLQKIINMILIG